MASIALACSAISGQVVEPSVQVEHSLLHYVNPEDPGTIQSVLAYYPATLDSMDCNHAIVLSHGFGTWEEQKLRWLPLAVYYARRGYIALYPETRQGRWDLGITDLLTVVDIARSHGAWNIESIGMVAGSFGNRDALGLVQTYGGVVDAYAALYGSLEEGWPYFHFRRDNIEEMDSAFFQQVGDEDFTLIPNKILWHAVELWNEPINHMGYVYEYAGHGFFFDVNNPAAAEAWKQQLQFFNWQLRGASIPGWWEEPVLEE